MTGATETRQRVSTEQARELRDNLRLIGAQHGNEVNTHEGRLYRACADLIDARAEITRLRETVQALTSEPLSYAAQKARADAAETDNARLREALAAETEALGQVRKAADDLLPMLNISWPVVRNFIAAIRSRKATP